MSLIGTLLGYALPAFVLLLIARMVLDWAGLLANGPRWVDQARALTHAGTEPVISPVRRVLQPVRASGPRASGIGPTTTTAPTVTAKPDSILC